MTTTTGEFLCLPTIRVASASLSHPLSPCTLRGQVERSLTPALSQLAGPVSGGHCSESGDSALEDHLLRGWYCLPSHCQSWGQRDSGSGSSWELGKGSTRGRPLLPKERPLPNARRWVHSGGLPPNWSSEVPKSHRPQEDTKASPLPFSERKRWLWIVLYVCCPLFVYFFFKDKTHCVAHAGHELVIRLPQPPEAAGTTGICHHPWLLGWARNRTQSPTWPQLTGQQHPARTARTEPG